MFRLALCQIGGSPDKEANIAKAGKYIREAAANGAQVIALPEMWNCPYSNDYFRKFAEPADGRCVQFMSEIAKELGVYLIGGTIAELEDDKVYNTCFCFGREGELLGKHRKVHLFDIDVGAFRFMESDTLTAGDEVTVIDTEFCKIGIAICYDVRFPDLTMKMALQGAKLVVLPAAFNTTTGPAHWDKLMQVRAMDSQVYFAACAPAQVDDGIFKAYGNSCIADPWSEFIAHTDEKEGVLYGDIDLDYVDKIRGQLPLLKHRRPEIYREENK